MNPRTLLLILMFFVHVMMPVLIGRGNILGRAGQAIIKADDGDVVVDSMAVEELRERVKTAEAARDSIERQLGLTNRNFSNYRDSHQLPSREGIHKVVSLKQTVGKPYTIEGGELRVKTPAVFHCYSIDMFELLNGNDILVRGGKAIGDTVVTVKQIPVPVDTVPFHQEVGDSTRSPVLTPVLYVRFEQENSEVVLDTIPVGPNRIAAIRAVVPEGVVNTEIDYRKCIAELHISNDGMVQPIVDGMFIEAGSLQLYDGEKTYPQLDLLELVKNEKKNDHEAIVSVMARPSSFELENDLETLTFTLWWDEPDYKVLSNHQAFSVELMK